MNRFSRWLCGKEVKELAARLEKLEANWNTIETEWTEWYEKFRLLHLRLAKRQQALAKAELAEGDGQPVGGPQAVEGSGSSQGRLLTSRQLEVQQQILRRRAGGGGQ